MAGRITITIITMYHFQHTSTSQNLTNTARDSAGGSRTTNIIPLKFMAIQPDEDIITL